MLRLVSATQPRSVHASRSRRRCDFFWTKFCRAQSQNCETKKNTPMKIKLIVSGVLCALEVSSFAQLTDNQRNGAQIGGPNLAEAEYQKSQDLKNRWLKNPKAIIRVVNGKIYNIQTNTAWQWIGGVVSSKTDSGLLIIYQRNIKNFALRNYSGDATADKQIYTFAIRVGTYDLDGSTPVELWDCGTPYVPPPPTPEQIKAAQESAKIAAQRERKKTISNSKQRGRLASISSHQRRCLRTIQPW
jgi:hypothetical protein